MSKFQQMTRGLAFFSRFAPSFTAIGFKIRSRQWDMKTNDLTGQTWLVSGATAGIGEATVLAALRQGANVIAVARSDEKLAALKRAAKHDADRLALWKAELSLQSEIHRLLAELIAQETKIDVLVNNVGILNHHHTTTNEGHETSYATNLLNHHILSQGLIDDGALVTGARLINVASGGLYNVPRNTYMLDQGASDFNGLLAYASHKRAQVALADYYQAQDQSKDKSSCCKLRCYAMHPGWVKTPGVKTSLPAMHEKMGNILRTPAQGADTILWLGATGPAPQADKIWFDRKARSPYVFKHTRKAEVSVDEVVAYLEKDATNFQNTNQ